MMQRQSVSLCAFMPDRLADPNAHSANQTRFNTLSQMLSRNNLVSFKVFSNPRVISGNLPLLIYMFPRQVAFAPFDLNNRRGPGVLIFPVLTPADSLLAGAVLMSPELLDTITLGGTPPHTGTPAQYQQATATQHTTAYPQLHQAYGYPPTNPSSNVEFSRVGSERTPSYFMQYGTQYQQL